MKNENPVPNIIKRILFILYKTSAAAKETENKVDLIKIIVLYIAIRKSVFVEQELCRKKNP